MKDFLIKAKYYLIAFIAGIGSVLIFLFLNDPRDKEEKEVRADDIKKWVVKKEQAIDKHVKDTKTKSEEDLEKRIKDIDNQIEEKDNDIKEIEEKEYSEEEISDIVSNL